MRLLLWFGSGLLGVIIWLFVNALTSESSDEFTNSFLDGPAIIIYIFVILSGFIGAVLLMATYLLMLIWHISVSLTPSKALGKYIYDGVHKIFKRKEK